jgi:hypothetical protein
VDDALSDLVGLLLDLVIELSKAVVALPNAVFLDRNAAIGARNAVIGTHNPATAPQGVDGGTGNAGGPLFWGDSIKIVYPENSRSVITLPTRSTSRLKATPLSQWSSAGM